MRALSILIIFFGCALLCPAMLQVLNGSPLASPMENYNGDPPSFLLPAGIFVTISAIGFLDGWLNTHHGETRVQWWFQSLFAGFVGVLIGMLYNLWPVADGELWVRVSQCTIAVGGSTVCLALAHIAGYRHRLTEA